VEPNSCNPGVDSAFVGTVSGSLGDLAPLNAYGNGSVRIGRRGTSGSFQVDTPAEFLLGEAEHTVITACDDPQHPGQPTNSTTTDCTEKLDEEASVAGAVEAGVGDRVRLSWNVSATGGSQIGSAIPLFTCVEQLEFADADCKSRRVSLSVFTQKNFKLRYRCVGTSLAVPVGQRYTEYAADTRISGSLTFKRKKHR
jgi:hypothetical protein